MTGQEEPRERGFARRLEEFSQNVDTILEELGRVIYGQREVLGQLLACVAARGHCLMIGVPGLAKTMMVSCLAEVTSLTFRRIQFTPDLMPSDITGTNVLDESTGKREFRFMPGPLFAHIVLGDEINRTPPKTQAALLQAMQERQVTVGQTTYDLPSPFFVIATQNPIEQEGTYPLPEAQLDRFMFNINIDYPDELIEQKILAETTRGPRARLKSVIDGQQILDMQDLVEDIVTSPYVVQYTADVIRASRPSSQTAPEFIREFVDWGVGPRAGQHLLLGAKAMAAMDGRVNVSLSDIRDVARPILRHRIACNFQAQAQGIDSDQIVRMLLDQVPEPAVSKHE
ncbi:MAG: MoxR family ATPase [Candidatus Brocadiaceae bacterium]|jgi:MoxR-like ATPase